VRSPEIRERFLHFFEDRGHHRLPSAPLVAHDDPTVLFTVAGMVPLQPYFRGVRTPPSPRITSCQKCLRTVDIEEVGDTSHNTFFEMLGNFSFGDYFKEGAITLAWELLTREWGLDPDRLWPSVHPGDAAALDLWVNSVGVPRERVSFLEDNFWGPAGPSGPCGYDSEIYWDWGAPCSCGREDCRPDTECGGDRWTEVWNLVFPEFDQAEDGTRTPLPRPGIDTGMGLERITSVLQGVRSIYETDLFAPLISDFRQRAQDGAAESADRQRSLNVLADHLRASSFLIADGVTPANEARGYVLRRLIRRAAVHGRRIGLRGGLAQGVSTLVEVTAGAYPELDEHRSLVERTLRTEEEVFERTLVEGTERLEALIGGGHRITRIEGADAFRLHDTFGFPIELTVELARERGVDVDLEGFAAAMAEQRARSKGAAAQAAHADVPALPPTTFVGYETTECEAEILFTGAGVAHVVIEPSPFYAEAGGQVGDRGELTWEGGRATVVDTQFFPGTDIRYLTLVEGPAALRPGMRVTARVDPARRAQTARHHSATHLLHKALKEVLGDEVVQRGSLVEASHTTFDFAFTRALTSEELRDIQHRVNSAIRRDLQRSTDVMPIAEARRTGAVALFGEKYGEQVRVVDFGGWSRELCGGTHVNHTGELGAAIILSESSIGQGTRRIDMVVGEAAEQYWTTTATSLRSVAQRLRVKPEEVPQRVEGLQKQIKDLQRELADAKRRRAGGSGVEGAEVEELGSVRFAHLVMDGDADREAVKTAADSLFSERLQADGVALVLGESALAVKVGGGPLQGGVRAGDLARVAAAATGAKGGGRPDFAQGGVADSDRRREALDAVRRALGGGGR
jgi:alanyl-tRNA synthetase